ncbi:MAG TPA: oligosaccharide flippase family protein, partial [Steroidobacteraceae bacterium]|nr:oligosaccharide flippase family protein [Steroidobacteraceae bacterium]
LLALGVLALAPFVSRFYEEPRLFWVAVALAPAVLLNSAGVQHTALLQRRMRFATLSAIDVGSFTVSTAAGIAMAAAGFGYWSLVAATVLQPILGTACLWVAAGWVPGKPSLGGATRSMLGFGGTISLLRIVTYATTNLDKVLVGRFWGASALGIYGRAYQLINVPTLLLNSAVAEVGFALLARVQGDRGLVRSYFLRSYSLVLAMTVPITICAWELAPGLVSVVLGPQWRQAAPLLRLLAPTILAFALIDPITWLMYSQGMLRRSFRVTLAFAPVVIAGYLIGLPFGARGVALGFSVAIVLTIVPRIAWGVHGTGITLADLARAVRGPLLSGAAALAAGLALPWLPQSALAPLPRLVIDSALLLAVYALVLLYVFGEKAVYFAALRTILGRPGLSNPS